MKALIVSGKEIGVGLCSMRARLGPAHQGPLGGGKV